MKENFNGDFPSADFWQELWEKNKIGMEKSLNYLSIKVDFKLWIPQNINKHNVSGVRN